MKSEDGEEDDILCAVKGVLSMLDCKTASTSEQKADIECSLEKRPLKELYELMEQHKGHLKFLQENGMCSENDKSEIVSHVKTIYSVISNRSKSAQSNKKVS